MQKRIISLIFTFVLCFSLTETIKAEEMKIFYVSENGSDSNAGTEENPLKTLDGALKRVRESGYLKKKKIEVVFKEGTYHFDKTVNFTADDSGSREFPVTYKGAVGTKVYFDGGYKISYSDKRDITNLEMKKRFLPDVVDKIKVIDLKKYGITSIAPVTRQDIYIRSTYSPQRLYVDDEEFVQARWPNKNEWTYTGTVIDPGLPHGGNQWGNTNGFDARGGTFTYLDDRIERYKDIENVWIFGRFFYDWAPNSTSLINIDKENKTITTKYNSYELYAKDKPYYYFNVPEELDCMGEYYIDPSTKELYFYDEGITDSSTMYLTDLGTVLIDLKYTHYVCFENLVIQGSRTTAITASECRGIEFNDCTLRYIGYEGMNLNGGWEYIVDGCEIYHVGSSAIIVNSGNVVRLLQSGTRIINNNIHDFNMWDGLADSAIYMYGVGEVAANNEIHGGTKSALGSGCRSVVEYNDIYDVMTAADDAGMIYMHSTGSQAGTHLRNNFLHSSYIRGTISSTGTWGIYFDCFGSQYNVYNNIFYDLSGGLHINGGQCENVYNNLFVNVERDFFVHAFTSHSTYVYWIDFENKNIPYDRGIWRKEYPKIAEYYDWNQFVMFKDNKIYNNISYNVAKRILEDSRVEDKPNYYKNNLMINENVFNDIENFDFTMGNKNPLPNEFNEIDTSKIGINKRSREEIENELPDYCKYY